MGHSLVVVLRLLELVGEAPLAPVAELEATKWNTYEALLRLNAMAVISCK